MIPTRRITLALLLGALSLGSCKKEAKKTTSCTAGFLYGYKGAHYDTLRAYPCTVGNINTTTAASTTLGAISNRVYFNLGAFNIADDCYYTFKENSGSPVDTLYRISMAGVVTPLIITSPGIRYGCLVYNRVTSKLYCIRTDGSAVSHIAEVTPGSISFSTTDIATTIYPEAHDNATVDNITGAIYYQSLNIGVGYAIEKYQPGATAPSAIVTGMSLELWGMKFNINNNMLYAIDEADRFVKLNTSGAITVLTTLSFPINMKFSAAALDPCSDHYIFSVKDQNTNSGHLYQLDMSGSVLQHDITAGSYQGLDVKY